MRVTGERFIPNANMGNDIEMEHMHRYCAVAPFLKGMKVLDAACGVGYGSKIISPYARSVIGIDIDKETIEYANQCNKAENIEFLKMSIGEMVFDDNSFDAVISFETIEHIDEQLQKEFLRNVSRVLSPDGFFVVSTPDLDVFKQKTYGTYVNPFHVKEYNKSDFEKLLKQYFPYVTIHTQEHLDCSVIDGKGVSVFGNKDEFKYGEYNIAVCSMKPVSLDFGGIYLSPENDKRVMLVSSVYYDYGEGYSEEHKEELFTLHKPDGSFSFGIDPSELLNLRAIRIDPCYFPAEVSLSVTDNIGTEINPVALNVSECKDGMDVFGDSIASYEIRLASFKGLTPFAVNGRFVRLSQDKIEEYKDKASHSGSDEYNASEDNVAYVYFDVGSGYCDELHQQIEPKFYYRNGYSVYKIEKIPTDCVKVRFDPTLNKRCVVGAFLAVSNIRVCSSYPLNGIVVNDVIVFSETSPQIEIELPAGTQWLEISAKIDRCSVDHLAEVFSAVQGIPVLKTQVDSLQKRFGEIKSTMALNDKLTKQYEESSLQNIVLSAKLEELKNEFDNINRRYSEQIERNAVLNERYTGLKKEYEENQTKLQKITYDYHSLLQENSKQAEVLKIAQESYNELFESHSLQAAKLKKVLEANDRLENEVEQYVTNNDSMRFEITKLKERLDYMNSEINSMTEINNYLESECSEEKSRIQELEDAICKLTADRNAEASNSAALTQQIVVMDRHILDITNELRRVKAQYESISNSRSWKITSPMRHSLDWIKSRKCVILTRKAMTCLKVNGIKATWRKVKEYFKKKKKVQDSSDDYIMSANFKEADNFSDLIAMMQSVEGAEVYIKEVLSGYDKKSAKKILLVSHELDLTGAPVAIFYFAQVLKEEGFCPVIISPRAGRLIETVISEDIPVIMCPCLYSSSIIRSFAGLFDLVAASTIVSAPVVNSLVGMDIPVFWWVHEAEASYTEEHIKRMPQFLPEHVTVSAGGEYAKERLKAHFPEYSVSQFLYYVPDDSEESDVQSTFSLPTQANGKKIFCVIGMLEYRKGQDIAVEAIRNLSSEEISSSYFVFVGRQCYPENYDRIMELCNQYPNNVFYTGELAMADLRRLERQIDCMLCPSRDDPMPIVVTEVLELSKIVICSENTGSAALIRAENGGLVYGNNDPLNLRDQISYVIKNIDSLDDMRANARKIYTKYFSKSVFRRNVLEIVTRLLKEKTKDIDHSHAEPLKPESMSMKQFLKEFREGETTMPTDYVTLEQIILDYDKDPDARRILLVSHEFSRTGAPIALQYLAESFKRNGAQVIIVSPFDGPMVEELNNNGIPTLVYKNLYCDNFLKSQALKFDMIVLCTVVAYQAVTILADCGTPVIWWIHDSAASYTIGGFGNCLPQKIPSNVTIFCGGEYAKQQLLKHYPNYSSQLLYYTVPDIGQESANYTFYDVGKKKDRFMFSVIGTQDYRKGHDILVTAIRQLDADERNRCQFLFIGAHLDKEIQDSVDSLCEEYPDNVSYITQVSRNELMSVYQQCDCIICSSRDDPLPVFVTESMMLKKTVICSENTGWAPIIEREKCGLIYHNNSAAELAEKMRYVLENNNDLTEMRENGRMVYQKYFSQEAFDKESIKLMKDHFYARDKEKVFYGTVSVIIPTFNAGDQFEKLLLSLYNQKGIRKVEIVVVDSGSSDNTAALCQKYNVVFHAIAHEDFSHSYARNKGAMLAKGDVLIFMTQDAMPSDDNWASTLIKPIITGEAVAATCREHCPEGTDLFYRVASWNHAGYQGILNGDKLNVGSASKSPDELRQKATLNDVSNAVRADVFRCFYYRFNYAEDLDLGLRLLANGYAIKLISSTETVHGHNRNSGYYLKRGYVESVALGKIYQGWKAPIEDDVVIVNKIVSGYKLLWSAIAKTRAESKITLCTDGVFTSILHNMEYYMKRGAASIETVTEETDPLVAEFISKITPWYDTQNNDLELCHHVAYYLENVLRKFLHESGNEEIDCTMQSDVYECMKKQYCLTVGNILARLNSESAVCRELDYLREGV